MTRFHNTTGQTNRLAVGSSLLVAMRLCSAQISILASKLESKEPEPAHCANDEPKESNFFGLYSV